MVELVKTHFSGDVRLEPMTDARYREWTEQTITGFADQQIASGVMNPTAVHAYAEEQFDLLMPQGLLTDHQHVWSAFDDAAEDEVGYLWLGLRPRDDRLPGLQAYVYDVAVRPELRGRGYGRAIMRAGQERAAELGASAIRLNVFGHNAAARGLYESLGYDTVATLMHKDLP